MIGAAFVFTPRIGKCNFSYPSLKFRILFSHYSECGSFPDPLSSPFKLAIDRIRSRDIPGQPHIGVVRTLTRERGALGVGGGPEPRRTHSANNGFPEECLEGDRWSEGFSE